MTGCPSAASPVADARTPGLVSAAVMADSQRVMTDKVGVLRTASGMAEAVDDLAALANKAEDDPRTESWSVTNLVTISSALATAALLREETRGSHWREDFPERDDEHWRGHIDAVLADGVLRPSYHPDGVRTGA